MTIHTCKLVVGVPAFLIVGFIAGCSNGASNAAPSAAEQQSQQQQIMNKIQNDPKMPPEVKANIMRQMQSEAAQRQMSPPAGGAQARQ